MSDVKSESMVRAGVVLFWGRAVVVMCLCAVFLYDCRGGPGPLGVAEAFFGRLTASANVLLAILTGVAVFMVYTEGVLKVFGGKIGSVVTCVNAVLLIKLLAINRHTDDPVNFVV